MEKRTNILLLLVGILVAIMLLYVLITTQFSKNGNAGDGSAQETTNAIPTTAEATIAKFSYTLDDQTYTFEKNKEVWSYVEDAKFPLDQTKLTDMLTALTTVQSRREIENAQEQFAEFGLDKPKKVVTVTTTDGVTMRYTIGSENTFASQYYMTMDETGTVHMIDSSFVEAFSKDLYDLMTLYPLPSIDPSIIQKVVLTQGDLTTTYRRVTENETRSWMMQQNDTAESTVDTGIVDALLQKCTEFSKGTCIDYSLSADEKNEYGMEVPSTVISLFYMETVSAEAADTATANLKVEVERELKFSLGKTTENNSIYIMCDGSNMVYSIPALSFD